MFQKFTNLIQGPSWAVSKRLKYIPIHRKPEPSKITEIRRMEKILLQDGNSRVNRMYWSIVQR